jgi:hypothetical protein
MAPRDGDGLGMAPRPGEPESALLPGMAAPRPPAPQIGPVERFGLFGHVQLGSMPDTSVPGPVALETPVPWTYDFDPATGNARATFGGIVVPGSGAFISGLTAGTGITIGGTASVPTVGITNQIVAAGPIGSAAAIPVITYNAQGQLTVVGTAAVAGANSVTVFLAADLVYGTSTAFQDGPNTGAIGAAGQIWAIGATAQNGNATGANANIETAIFNGSVYIANDNNLLFNAEAKTTTLAPVIVTLTGPTTFTLRGRNASGAAGSMMQTTGVATGVANKASYITAIRLA